MPQPSGTLDFIRFQLEIFHVQSDAIKRGDLVAAKTAGNQLSKSLPGLIQLVNHSRNGGKVSEIEKEDIERMVSEMKTLQKSSTESLNLRKDNLAQLLNEFRKGRKLLNRYSSGRKSGSKLFDMVG